MNIECSGIKNKTFDVCGCRPDGDTRTSNHFIEHVMSAHAMLVRVLHKLLAWQLWFLTIAMMVVYLHDNNFGGCGFERRAVSDGDLATFLQDFSFLFFGSYRAASCHHLKRVGNTGLEIFFRRGGVIRDNPVLDSFGGKNVDAVGQALKDTKGTLVSRTGDFPRYNTLYDLNAHVQVFISFSHVCQICPCFHPWYTPAAVSDHLFDPLQAVSGPIYLDPPCTCSPSCFY